jgi:hypothetical protein
VVNLEISRNYHRTLTSWLTKFGIFFLPSFVGKPCSPCVHIKIAGINGLPLPFVFSQLMSCHRFWMVLTHWISFIIFPYLLMMGKSHLTWIVCKVQPLTSSWICETGPPPKKSIYIYTYPLVNVYKTMENHHFQWENPLFLWPFSIAM